MERRFQGLSIILYLKKYQSGLAQIEMEETVQGLIASLGYTKENKKRYTAYTHIEQVIEDYEKLK